MHHFSFDRLHPKDCDRQVSAAEDVGFKEALEVALGIEEEEAEIHRRIAEQSRSFLATISLAFAGVAKKRKARIKTLESMLSEV